MNAFLATESKTSRAWLYLSASLALIVLVLSACGSAQTVQEEEGEAPPLIVTVAETVQDVGVQPAAATVDVGGPAVERATPAEADTGVAVERQPSTLATEPEPAEAAGTAGKASAVAPDARPLDTTTNILVLGSDRRPDTPNWRTDVMMVVTLDSKNGRAGVISIPRDVYLEEIPGHQPNRINVVDYLGEKDDADGGGPALLATIIESRMGIPIHHYLRFNFDSFRDVVDALGGVEVDVDCEFRGYVEEEGGWLVLEPGLNRLTGHQAMIYVRDRELTGGDLGRARRQQRFVWAVRNQVLNENLLPRLPALYSAFSDSIDTDIGLVTTLRLARLALDLDPDNLYGMVVAPPEMVEMGWAQGMSVFLPNWDVIADHVQQIFESPPFAVGNTPEDCVRGQVEE